MPQCPVCESFQVVVVVSPSPSAWCDRCGARWIQQGGEQRAIMREPVAYPREWPAAHRDDRFSRVPAYFEPALDDLGA
jgi:Zn-finger nucleic acid-binding protein